MTSSMPAASAFFLMPSSTLAQKVMSRSRLAKARTYFSPFLGGVLAMASTTAAARFSAESISPEKPVGAKAVEILRRRRARHQRQRAGRKRGAQA